jgi:hypothetical protein
VRNRSERKFNGTSTIRVALALCAGFDLATWVAARALNRGKSPTCGRNSCGSKRYCATQAKEIAHGHFLSFAEIGSKNFRRNMGDNQQRRATRGRCLLRGDWDLFDSVCSRSVFGTSSIDSGRRSDNRGNNTGAVVAPRCALSLPCLAFCDLGCWRIGCHSAAKHAPFLRSHRSMDRSAPRTRCDYQRQVS